MPVPASIFPPRRDAALERLRTFLPNAAQRYASQRNADLGPEARSGVSQLSPYVRYRLVTEAEIVTQVLARHSFSAAEKYVQEVLWRTYWKGWLEMRPAVWGRFVTERDHARDSFPNARAIAAAENGMTGIEGFDDWARELVANGYLHNHARMWFASIWIFTLRLPWTLGADFFLRHLLDADAASNTLSWRWVAGLQTVGKTYLATADNIARYTNGRFAPKGLATEARALVEEPVSGAQPLPPLAQLDPGARSLLLVTHEDLHPESVIPRTAAVVASLVVADRALLWGEAAGGFVAEAAQDSATRASMHFNSAADVVETLDAGTLVRAARSTKATQIVTPYAPVGPVADALTRLEPALAEAGMKLVRVQRRWDSQFWPHAKKGFFPFKERIPALLREDGLQ